MIKIGIITFQNAINIGAILQTYALEHYIRENIGDCEVINFIPNSDIPRLPYRLNCLLHNIRLYYTNSSLYYKEKNIHDFKKNIAISKRTFVGDNEIIKSNLPYEVMISGSDQILNMTLTGNSLSYYLNFFDGKKISYASSFGRTNISHNEIYAIRKELSKFNAISVRETSAISIIQNETGIKPELVLDPVFLLDEDVWNKVCNNNLSLPPKYIFVYSMEDSSILINVLNFVIKKTGLPVIVVYGGGKEKNINGIEDSTCGPKEFIRYINNAEYVITNSFHGTAFSIIFKKKLFCVAHSSRNTRIENIMQLINKKDNIISKTMNSYDEMVVDCNINYNNLERYIKLSKEYLFKNLQ